MKIILKEATADKARLSSCILTTLSNHHDLKTMRKDISTLEVKGIRALDAKYRSGGSGIEDTVYLRAYRPYSLFPKGPCSYMVYTWALQ